MLKYLVEIDYKRFEFVSASDAMNFATIAKLNTKKGDDYDVTITLKDVSDASNDNTETEEEI